MRFFLILTAFCLTSISAQAQSLGEMLLYTHGETPLEGYWVNSQCESDSPDPVILIVHQWKGLSDHEKNTAKQCYNAFAIDMYGKDIRPQTNGEAAEQSSKYKNNPELARGRLNSALAFAQEKAGTNQTAIIGYCFGGTMALELARSGAPIDAAISFHGGLASKAPATQEGQIKASVQIHHGDADPHVKPEEVNAFLQEMRVSKADWSFTRYADAVHAFTHEDAGNDPSKGVAYNHEAAERSWSSTLEFLKMAFAANE